MLYILSVFVEMVKTSQKMCDSKKRFYKELLRGINTNSNHTFWTFICKVKIINFIYFFSASRQLMHVILYWSVNKNSNKIQWSLSLKCDKMWKNSKVDGHMQYTEHVLDLFKDLNDEKNKMCQNVSSALIKIKTPIHTWLQRWYDTL